MCICFDAIIANVGASKIQRKSARDRSAQPKRDRNQRRGPGEGRVNSVIPYLLSRGGGS